MLPPDLARSVLCEVAGVAQRRCARTGEENTLAKAAHFKVDPKLASLLGQGYRSSEEALRELVDNAWDADAENVSIRLPAELSGSSIVIEDDGTGMTENELRGEYLVVASDRRSRKGQHTAEKKRPVKGRKGIGKFAGLTAADTMILETRARGRRCKLTIRKKDLLAAVGERDLERVDLPIEISDCRPSDHGTKITLTGLSQNLAFPSAERLKQLLVVEYDRKEDFNIQVNGEPIVIDDIPGETFERFVELPDVGSVRLKFKIAGDKLLKNAGIVIRVGGKVVGRPTMLGLDQDEEIPSKLLRRLYGEIEADGLSSDVTADWGAIIENSLGLGAVRQWAIEQLAPQVKHTFKKEVNLQKARLAKELKQRLQALPENRRKAAEEAINRVLERFYAESEEKIATVVGLMLEAFETDVYWLVLKNINDATRADVTKLAEVLDEFGIVDIAMVAQQGKHRLEFLDEFDRLITNPATLEVDVHRAVERNLWLLGPGYRLVSSNKSLANLLATWMKVEFRGVDAQKRPDLFLAAMNQQTYLLIEFKRPSHVITRDDEHQANIYRDALHHQVPGTKIEILMLGGGRDPKVSSHYETAGLRVASLVELVAQARHELTWLLDQLRA